MALSSARLVSSIISPLAGKGEPDCSKTKLTIHYALGNITRYHFPISVLGEEWNLSGNIPESEVDGGPQNKCQLIFFYYIKNLHKNLHIFFNKVITSAESSPWKETRKRKKEDSTAVSRKLSDLMDRLVSTSC